MFFRLIGSEALSSLYPVMTRPPVGQVYRQYFTLNIPQSSGSGLGRDGDERALKLVRAPSDGASLTDQELENLRQIKLGRVDTTRFHAEEDSQTVKDELIEITWQMQQLTQRILILAKKVDIKTPAFNPNINHRVIQKNH